MKSSVLFSLAISKTLSDVPEINEEEETNDSRPEDEETKVSLIAAS